MFTHLKYDVLASFVVFLVALPLCMGIALASGLPVQAGIITGIIGGLVVGLISGAPLQVSGPAAGLIVLVLSYFIFIDLNPQLGKRNQQLDPGQHHAQDNAGQ